MGDALCGPSNPLQNIQKQTAVDRSLQQDRFKSRQSPAQSFRSDPGRNAGGLDAEFEAFQAGPPAGFLERDPFPASRPQIPHPVAPSFHSPPGPSVSDWASDFQRLHVSPPPRSTQQNHSQPLAASHNARHQSSVGWHPDFQSQRLQTTSTYPQMAFGNQYNYREHPMSTLSTAGPSSVQDSGISREEQEAFEREFEARAMEMLEFTQSEVAQQSAQAEGDILTSAETRNLRVDGDYAEPISFPLQDMMDQVGGDIAGTVEPALDAEAKHSEPLLHPPEPDDDLALTARELLDRVSDNTSQKFERSRFLDLMRKIRDREVKVEGDQMVDADGTPMNRPSSPIPPSEQDDDRGRDIQMAGALGSNDAGQSASTGTARRTTMFTHLVDDF